MIYALKNYTFPLLLALVLHAAAALALYQGWNPEKERLNFVQPKAVMANLIVLEAKAKPAPPPKVDTAARERQAREGRAQAEKDKARKAAAEEAARKKAEREAAERKLAEQQKIAQREAEQEQARKDRLARLSELAATSLEQAIEEESAEFAEGSEEMVVRSYHAAIYDLVRRNWSRPPSSRTGMQARLQVELIPTGEVVAVTIIESSGNTAFDRSAEHAVRGAKRFEVPQDNALFEKHFRRFYFLFQPEDLLR